MSYCYTCSIAHAQTIHSSRWCRITWTGEKTRCLFAETDKMATHCYLLARIYYLLLLDVVPGSTLCTLYEDTHHNEAALYVQDNLNTLAILLNKNTFYFLFDCSLFYFFLHKYHYCV